MTIVMGTVFPDESREKSLAGDWSCRVGLLLELWSVLRTASVDLQREAQFETWFLKII